MICLSYFKMERQQYSLKVGFWKVNGLFEEKASDDLLQNEMRKYDILFLGETWQYKDNLENLHHPLGYFHDFVDSKKFDKKERPSWGMLVYYRGELQEKGLVYDKPSEKLFGLR